MAHHQKQINSVIKEELSLIIVRQIEWPADLWATITKVETTPDLKNAKVFISIIPSQKSGTALELLNRKIYPLQKELNTKIRSRIIPKINFTLDRGGDKAERIDQLLAQIK